MAQNMGIGMVGSPKVILKRKFRYTVEWTPPSGSAVEKQLVKVASRPQLDIDETEIHFLNGITWIPGKGRWQPLTVTYYDVADDTLQPLYDWIASVYDFNKALGESDKKDSGDLKQTEKEGWAGSGILTMLDGCGETLETWEFADVWPQSINFGDLDYSTADECTIDVTFRYSKAKLTKGSANCGVTPVGVCKGCTSGGSDSGSSG